MCRKRARLNQLYNNDSSEVESSQEDDFFVGVVSLKYQKGKPKWMVDINTNGENLTCQIDTGAEANVISHKEFSRVNFNWKDIKRTNTVITAVGGHRIKLFGKIDLNLHNGKTFKTTFLVIDGDTDTLIGLKTSMDMDLININGARDNGSSNNIGVNKIFWFDNYSELFNGLGCLKDICHLTVKENANPIVDPPRRIPLKAELDRMMSLGVIEPVTEPLNG